MDSCNEIEIAKLKLRPDDVLLIKIPDVLPSDRINDLQNSIFKKVGTKCLIMPKNIDVSIISKSNIPTKAGE